MTLSKGPRIINSATTEFFPQDETFAPAINIRPATEDDLDLILTKFGNKTDLTAEELAENRAELQEMLKNPIYAIRIIQHNAEDVGWVLEETCELPHELEVIKLISSGENEVSDAELVQIFQKPAPGTSWLSIDAIEIMPTAQNQGLGQKVFAQLLTEYEQHNIDIVTFHTGVTNEAMKKIGINFGFTLLLVPQVKGTDGQPIDANGQIFAVKSLDVSKKISS